MVVARHPRRTHHHQWQARGWREESGNCLHQMSAALALVHVGRHPTRQWVRRGGAHGKGLGVSKRKWFCKAGTRRPVGAVNPHQHLHRTHLHVACAESVFAGWFGCGCDTVLNQETGALQQSGAGRNALFRKHEKCALFTCLDKRHDSPSRPRLAQLERMRVLMLMLEPVAVSFGGWLTWWCS